MAGEPSWELVTTRQELLRAQRLTRWVGATEVLCVMDRGEIRVWSNVCPHKLGPLSEGEVGSGHVRCPWHGWSYDLATGRIRTGGGFRSLTATPEQEKRLPELELSAVPWKLDGDAIYVDRRFDGRTGRCADGPCGDGGA